jgi:hypothetical protein
MKKLSLFLVAALLAPAMASAQDAATSGAPYPRCSATVTDQCTEGGGMGMMAHHKMMKHSHHKHHAKAKAKK